MVSVEDNEKGSCRRRQEQHAVVDETVGGQKTSTNPVSDRHLLGEVVAISGGNTC